MIAIRNTLNLGISLKEFFIFIIARVGKNETDLTILGIKFKNVDRILWTHIFHIIFLQEYSPEGFGINKDDVVIDIGANKGVFVALAASNDASRILAYEPDIDNYDYLQWLIENNNLLSVELSNQAVSGKNGILKLYQSERNTRHSILGFDVATGQKLENYVEIPSINLDTILKDFDSIDLLKMDCEGAEFEIISSVSEKSLNKVEKIVMEYHSSIDSPALSKLLNKLRKFGYDVVIGNFQSEKPFGMLFAIRQ